MKFLNSIELYFLFKRFSCSFSLAFFSVLFCSLCIPIGTQLYLSFSEISSYKLYILLLVMPIPSAFFILSFIFFSAFFFFKYKKYKQVLPVSLFLSFLGSIVLGVLNVYYGPGMGLVVNFFLFGTIFYFGKLVAYPANPLT